MTDKSDNFLSFYNNHIQDEGKKEYGKNRDQLIDFLSNKGVETRPFFIPLHTLPPFQKESKERKSLLSQAPASPFLPSSPHAHEKFD